MPEVRNRFKSILTGATYVVEKIKDKMVVLESENKKSWVLTELSNLKLFYKREEKEVETKPRYGIVNFEKRRYPRFSVDLPMEYTRRHLVAKQGRVSNVSESGLLVYCAEQIQIGQALRLKLFFPSGSELNMMEMVNKVVWMDVYKGKDWGDYRSGVKFVEISPADVDKLKSFLVSLPQ
jgi:c-di-GMP-binding flagellar brake protein YcgR